MANEYPDPVVLPDPQTFATGSILTGGTGQALELGRLSNYLIANMGRDTLGQAWPDGSLVHESAAFQEALRYKVPVPPGCTSITVRVWAGAAGGNPEPGAVRVVSTEGADTLDIAITAAAPGYYSGSVTVDRDADGMEELTVSLVGNTKTATPRALTLYSIGFEPAIQASPLPSTAKIGDATPLGITTIFAPDDAAPAWLYQALCDNLEALRDDYPRALGIWSAADSAISGADAIHQMPAQLFKWAAFGRLPAAGAEIPTEDLTVHARMVSLATARDLRFAVSPSQAAGDIMPSDGEVGASTTAGAAAAAWKDGTVEAVQLLDAAGRVEVLVAEFDASKGSLPQVVSLTVLA